MATEGPKSRFPSPQSTYDEIVERAARSYHEVEHIVERNPASAVLLAFGLGVGLGVWLGSSLVEAQRYRRHEPGMAERIGRQVIEALTGVLPESVSANLRR
jgi:hypothetical protein